MRHLISWAAALALPAVLLTGSLPGAPPKADDKDLDKTSPKMLKAGELVGKIAAINESKKSLRVKITYALPKLNVGEYNALVQAQRQYAVAVAKRDYNGARNAQLQMALHQAKLYTYENKTYELEVATVEDVVVRNNKPPEQFDEKGKPKKYTKAELKELKGPNPKLPGYTAEFSDIQQDQLVRFHLVKQKGARPVKPKPKGKDKDAELDLEGNLPQASMIVILAQPPAGK
jgi:hypothetical protein